MTDWQDRGHTKGRFSSTKVCSIDAVASPRVFYPVLCKCWARAVICVFACLLSHSFYPSPPPAIINIPPPIPPAAELEGDQSRKVAMGTEPPVQVAWADRCLCPRCMYPPPRPARGDRGPPPSDAGPHPLAHFRAALTAVESRRSHLSHSASLLPPRENDDWIERRGGRRKRGRRVGVSGTFGFIPVEINCWWGYFFFGGWDPGGVEKYSWGQVFLRRME